MAGCPLVFLTACFLIARYAVADSCSGRCGNSASSAYNCQCNTVCTRYNDCCADYAALCLGATCSGRCGQTHDNTKPCQCNTACATYGDCCSDYNSVCGNGGGSSGGSPSSLSDVIQFMWDRDVNRLGPTEISINTAGSRLFTNVLETKLSRPTFQAFIHLLDNYDRSIGSPEFVNTQELLEIEAFVDVIMKTEVMSLAYSFLEVNEKVNTQAGFRDVFMELWFNLYSRSSSSSTLDSSGFEHVLVGETKSTSVSGFHSWVQFYLEEKAGNIQYSHMVTTKEPSMKGAAFNWHGKYKSMGSFFLGTSPEFEMGVYTLCALMHKNARCNFNLQGTGVSIQTYDLNHKTGDQIATAYPAI